MRNIKDKVYECLAAEFSEDAVTDQYPNDWANLPAVQYTEEDNKVYEYTEQEDKSYVRYRIDIWHNRSTSEAALKIDRALSEFGLRRILCQDVPDPSGMKHKVMRYEAVIDNESDYIYKA